MVLFPSFIITTITASTTGRCAHLILVMTMCGLFKTIHAKYTGRIHTTFTATVKRFIHFEYASAYGRCILFASNFGQHRFRIITEHKFFEHINNGIFCTLFIETASCYKRNKRNPIRIKVDFSQQLKTVFLVPHIKTNQKKNYQ